MSRVHIHLDPRLAIIGAQLACDLQDEGFTSSHQPPDPAATEDLILEVPEGTPVARTDTLIATLAPLTPALHSVSADAPLRLHLGGLLGSSLNLQVFSDDAGLQEQVVQLLAPLGWAKVKKPALKTAPSCPELVYGGADPRRLSVLSYLLVRRLGFPQPQLDKSWDDDDEDVFVRIGHPGHADVPLRQWVPVQIRSDDSALAEALQTRLLAEGFHATRLCALGTSRDRFRVSGGLKSKALVQEVSDLVGDLLATTASVDLGNTPVISDAEGGDLLIDLPIAALRSGTLHPYAGGAPARFAITLRTDDREAVEPLSCSLREAGFSRVRIRPLEGTVLGAAIQVDAIEDHPVLLDLIRQRVDAFGRERGVSVPVRRQSDIGDEVRVLLPLQSLSRGDQLRQLQRASERYKITLFTTGDPDPRTDAVKRRLRAAGFRRIRLRPSSSKANGRSALLKFGGAPPEVIDHTVDSLSAMLGADPEREKAWGDSDRDIYIHLPPLHADTEIPSENGAFDVNTWLRAGNGPATRPFLQAKGDRLRVGEVELPISGLWDHPLTPRPDAFRHYVLDTPTAALLQEVALSVSVGAPLLLEGPTSASKTSAILALAAWLGHPVARLNLSGSTDCSELLGRLVPRGVGWVWQEGLVPRGMKEGFFVVLDELSLAEAAVVERLNGVLESSDPTLVLIEHDDEVIRPVPGFRLFATQNPVSGYAGRQALSPAFRDRWITLRIPDSTTDEQALKQMGHALLHGGRPAVSVGGVDYAAVGPETAPAVFPELAAVPEMDAFLTRLVRLHAMLARASRPTPTQVARLGGDRPESYVWTRRALLRNLRLLSCLLDGVSDPHQRVRAIKRVLVRCYLQAVDAEDQIVVLDLMDAAGLGPGTFTLSPGELVSDELPPAAQPPAALPSTELPAETAATEQATT